MNDERLDVLDGLRGCAILLVVWYHAWLVSGQTIAGVNLIAEAGFLGVDLFFFISGVCLFYPHARAAFGRGPQPGVRRFYVRRVLKIVPSYLIALAVFATAYHARFASPADAFVQIASHLTFLHTLNADTYGGISGPLWTIGVEVQFYLIFPLLAPWFRRSPLAAYAALLVAAQAYRLLMNALGFATVFSAINQLPAYLDVFGAGMLAAYAMVALHAYRERIDARRSTALSLGTLALAVVGLAAVGAMGRSADSGTVYAWVNAHRIAIGPLCILLALSASFATARWRGFVAAPWLVFLSVISYNLYLWNLEVAVWFRSANLAAPIAFAGSIATAVAIAAFITFAIERPILRGELARTFALFRSARTRTPSRA